MAGVSLHSVEWPASSLDQLAVVAPDSFNDINFNDFIDTMSYLKF